MSSRTVPSSQSYLCSPVVSLAILLTISIWITLSVSEHQYTWSLLIWISPAIALLPWLFFSRTSDGVRFAMSFCGAVAHAFVAGTSIAVFFAHYFYTFPNRGATLGVLIPSIDLFAVRIVKDRPFPLEDVVFYFVAAVSILTVYVWATNLFAGLRLVSDSRPLSKEFMIFVAESMALCVVVFGLGTVAKSFFNPMSQRPLPSYLGLLLVAVALIVILFSVFHRQINWSALITTLGIFIPLSYGYEVLLAVPGRWWQYEADPMIGIILRKDPEVPVECALLWLIAVLLMVVSFEGFRALQVGQQDS